MKGDPRITRTNQHEQSTDDIPRVVADHDTVRSFNPWAYLRFKQAETDLLRSPDHAFEPDLCRLDNAVARSHVTRNVELSSAGGAGVCACPACDTKVYAVRVGSDAINRIDRLHE